MSNTKVLNCSSSIRQPTTTTTTSVRSVGDYNMRQTTVNQQNSIKSKMMHIEAEKTSATQRVKDIKKLNANNLSPLNSPQLIRSTRGKVVESNGWNSSIKVKSSCSSGSNSVESIVPKYQIATNSSVLSQKRSYLNQTSTVNKLSNKTMSMRNDKSKKEAINESLSMQKALENESLKKKTVSTATTAKKLLKPTFASSSSPAKSFSAKFPNGLPFENEFYHYRKNRRSSIASDSTTTSNNSSDEMNHHQRLSTSPYQDEFRRNPSNDALYVDFTLKSFDNFDSDEDKRNKIVSKTSAHSTKTKYILTDKNCFCAFETVKSSSESSPKSNGQKLVDFITAPSAKRVNKDSVVYVTSANIFPKCNRDQQQQQQQQQKIENTISQNK